MSGPCGERRKIWRREKDERTRRAGEREKAKTNGICGERTEMWARGVLRWGVCTGRGAASERTGVARRRCE